MVDHAEGIRDILVALTGYGGGYYPVHRGLNEINASDKFLVVPKATIRTDVHWYSIEYDLILQASSETNLRTMINAFMNSVTDRSDGYIPSASYDSQTNLTDSTQCCGMEILESQAGIYPPSDADLTGTLDHPPVWLTNGDATNWQTTSNTMRCNVIQPFAEYLSDRVGTLGFPFPPQFNSNYATCKVGLYTTNIGNDPDLQIYIIDDYAQLDHVNYVLSAGYPTDDTWYQLAFLSTYKEETITPTADQFNEIDISTLVTAIKADSSAKIGDNINLLLRIKPDGETSQIDIARPDSDGDTTNFPYLKFNYDFTASGYPYWIGIQNSENIPKNLGPNKHEVTLTLIATYEVETS